MEKMGGQKEWPCPFFPTVVRPCLDLHEGLVPGLGHKYGRTHGPTPADTAVQPEGAGVANILGQVDERLGHEEADHEGEADDN